MAPRYMYGLIVGVIGLVLNACVAALVGICGPFTGILLGAIAGYLAASREKQPEKAGNARVGAIAGAITGVFMFVGQIIGGIGALAFIQFSGGDLPFGVASPATMTSTELIGFYAGGLGTGVCFGFIGLAIAALAGAAAAYFAPTGDQAAYSGD